MDSDTYRPFDPWRPTPVKEESRKQIVETHYFNVDRVAFSSAQVGQFERFILHENNGDTVGVLAVTADGKIPFVEQYRIPTHRWTLEIPAGHANAPSEQYLDVASRKLREEAGYEASKLTQFTRFINTPSFSCIWRRDSRRWTVPRSARRRHVPRYACTRNRRPWRW